jgi:hypothetical protein
MARQENTLVIEDAHIVFRNFAGKEGMYNKEGDRNFCVILEPDVAAAMDNDGWNIKHLKDRESGEKGAGDPYVEVAVGYKGRPPHIVMITSRGRTDITEDAVELLDWVEIKTVDVIIRPYNWDVNGSQGVKAYLKSMFITIEEDYLELKYSQVPDVPTVVVEEG